jgi:hypothetical protein
VLANVLARTYLHHSFLCADETARLTLSILAFIGGAVAYRRRDHAFVRIVLSLVCQGAANRLLGGVGARVRLAVQLLERLLESCRRLVAGTCDRDNVHAVKIVVSPIWNLGRIAAKFGHEVTG